MPYKDKEKQREYQRLWSANRRKEWFDANGSCRKCGSSEGLELDHVDPSKKVTHKVWSWTESKRIEELDKCQVLCNKCHKDKTSEQRPEAPHGNDVMYRSGCRCKECYEWKQRTNKLRDIRGWR